MATERQHQLDIVIDTKKAHWAIVQDMLLLFKSAPIYSNGKYKIITDRADLPVRQVFHSGNMMGRAEVRISQDPGQINQLTAEFANLDNGYEHDVYVLQDSTSIYGNNAPIKNADTSMVGLTRATEVARRLDYEMQRRQAQTIEVRFRTGLEGIAVEPGDHCVVGVITTDWELGYGGRVLDGSTPSFVADREVALVNGETYDLWLWHTDADSPEQRLVVGSATQATIVPTTPFTYVASTGDRWALGVQSSDLVLAQVKKVTHNQDGTIEIAADQYVPITVRQDCPNSLFASGASDIPSQPTSFTASRSGCTVCYQATFTNCQGGFTRGLSSHHFWGGIGSGYARLNALLDNSIHPPVESILVGNTISFVSGANSGMSSEIFSYFTISNTPAPQGTALFQSMPNPVASGTAYYVTFNTSHIGFRVDVATTLTGTMTPIATITGDSACVTVQGVNTISFIEWVPINGLGKFNQCGAWASSMNTAGCFNLDQGPPTSVFSITTQSLSTLLAASIPGSLITTAQQVQMRAVGFINESCLGSETTKVSFALKYVSSTVVDSLVINLRTADGLSVATNAFFTLKATFQALSVSTPAIIARLDYVGPCAGVSQVTTALASNVMSIDYSRVQSMSFTVDVEHVDTTGAVHSHGCHSIVLDHAEFQLL